MRFLVVILGAGLLVAAVAIVASHAPWPAALECAIFGALVLIGTLLEAHYTARRAGPAWQKTGERFVDPTTGKLTEVRYDPETGERAYESLDSKKYPPV
jgi:hypothetical protein